MRRIVSPRVGSYQEVNKPQPELTTPDGAAEAALQKAIDSVVAELKKHES
jgi:hypothetical protein